MKFEEVPLFNLFEVGFYDLFDGSYYRVLDAVKVTNSTFEVVASESWQWGKGFVYESRLLLPRAICTDHGVYIEDEAE